MHVPKDAVRLLDFEGLKISDYTERMGGSASAAVIDVAPGVRHRTARSSISDKFYFCLHGRVSFRVGERAIILQAQDLLVVHRGEWFTYNNETDQHVRLLLVHVPPFDLSAEEFQ